jgi:hypothetical protein
LDIPLDGSMVSRQKAPLAVAQADTKSRSRRMGRSLRAGQAESGSQEGRRPEDMAGDFLDCHPTAKIVVIIDTHCLEETGGFIYKGNTPDTYEACSMEEVSLT